MQPDYGLLFNTLVEGQERIIDLLGKLDSKLDLLTRQRIAKDFYSVEEAATIIGRAEYTVREWCRLKRVHAVKRMTGRGKSLDWSIPHEELERIRNHGLLPDVALTK